MAKIIDNSQLEVTKLKKSIKFIIKDKKNKTFYNSIKDVLNVSKKDNTFSIEGVDIIGLNDKLKSGNLNYINYKNLFLNLKKQLEFLIHKGICIYSIDIRDVYYIEIKKNKDNYLSEHYFAILKLNNYEKIEDNMITISKPLNFSEFDFISPELKKQKKFPMSVNYKTSYYSLGKLIHFCVSNSKNVAIKNQKKMLESVKETPIYWTILRCLEINPENRTLLYI